MRRIHAATLWSLALLLEQAECYGPYRERVRHPKYPEPTHPRVSEKRNRGCKGTPCSTPVSVQKNKLYFLKTG